MRWTSFCILFFGGILLSSPAQANCRHSDNSFNCVQYLRNYDGDTFTVRIPSVHPLLGEEISVRILGIDSPELRTQDTCEKRAAERAQKELADIFRNSSRISLRSIGRDKYFRVLAEVVVDGVDVGQEMLRRGMAVPYEGGERPKVDWCKR